MSVEVIEAQEQLQRARDNLRHVEEGIKKTTTSNPRFGDHTGGTGRPGRRFAGRIAGVQRFRAETEHADEPPYKKTLSSVASRLGPINTENKPNNDNDQDETPTLKSTVTLSQVQDRDSASSVVSDTKTLNRSKRLFGSLLMGTLRQFKQDKEKNKTTESKQAEMWDKINQKEAEQVALTVADRRTLESAKEEVNQEIRLLERKMELAEMKVRAVEERDTYTQFIRTKTKPCIYYLPKEFTDATTKSLKESNIRVNRLYETRIGGYAEKIADVEQKLDKLGGVEKQLGDLNTVKIEKISRTISNDNEEKISNPKTGIKVEVQLRNTKATELVLQSESEDEDLKSKSRTPERTSTGKARSTDKGEEKSDSRRKRSPKTESNVQRRRSSSPRKKSRSPRRPKTRSPPKRSRSPQERSPRRESRTSSNKRRSPLMKSRFSREKSRSPKKTEKNKSADSHPMKNGSTHRSKSKSPTCSRSTEKVGKTASSKERRKSGSSSGSGWGTSSSSSSSSDSE